MYTKEERERILWEFRQSGLSVPEACRRLPLFPTRANLYRWLRMEEAGRAGRDGDPASCYLLWNGNDFRLRRFLIEKSRDTAGLAASRP